MNLETFDTTYAAFGMKHRIKISCADCGTPREVFKEKARETIKHNGRYLCRSCSRKQAHILKPISKEVTAKIGDALRGIVRSPETRQKMSDAKKAYFETEEGQALKAKLSKLAAQGHADHKFEKAKRTGYHLSKITGRLMYYVSSYELLLCVQLDAQEDTVTSYDTQIPYDINDRSRCLDFLVEYKDGSKKAIEVKPASRLTEQANIDQIADSSTYAASQGWLFGICTEVGLGMTETEIRTWADGQRSLESDIDWVELRKEQNRAKANRHYEKKVATDTITVYCPYCEEDHTRLRVTYNKNVKKNGRFICHQEAAEKPKGPRTKKST